MKNSKTLIELDTQELTNLIKNQLELFIGETIKEIVISKQKSKRCKEVERYTVAGSLG